MTGTINCMVFSSTLQKYNTLLQKDHLVAMRVRISNKEDDEVLLVCNEVWGLQDGAPLSPGEQQGARGKRNGAPPGLYLRLPSLESMQAARAEALLQIFSGQTDVYVRLLDSGKLMRHPLRAGQLRYLSEQLKERIGEENVALVGDLFD